MFRRSGTFNASRRRAIAVVEMAIVLPVLVLIVLGSIQTCELTHLQHIATIVAHEGTFSAADITATRADVVSRTSALLTEMGVSGGTVTLNPGVAAIADAPIGSLIEVVVTVPTNGNLRTPRVLPVPETLTAVATVLR